jgi:hypothetical protein
MHWYDSNLWTYHKEITNYDWKMYMKEKIVYISKRFDRFTMFYGSTYGLSSDHSWLINGFVTRVTRRVPLVEQELLVLPDHLSSHSVFSGVRVTWSLVLCVMFCRSLFVPCRIVWSLYCLSSFDVWILLLLWYLQTLLHAYIYSTIYKTLHIELKIK